MYPSLTMRTLYDWVLGIESSSHLLMSEFFSTFYTNGIYFMGLWERIISLENVTFPSCFIFTIKNLNLKNDKMPNY